MKKFLALLGVAVIASAPLASVSAHESNATALSQATASTELVAALARQLGGKAEQAAPAKVERIGDLALCSGCVILPPPPPPPPPPIPICICTSKK